MLGQLGNGQREDRHDASDITRSFLPPSDKIVHVSPYLAFLCDLYVVMLYPLGISWTCSRYGSDRYRLCVRYRRRQILSNR